MRILEGCEWCEWCQWLKCCFLAQMFLPMAFYVVYVVLEMLTQTPEAGPSTKAEFCKLQSGAADWRDATVEPSAKQVPNIVIYCDILWSFVIQRNHDRLRHTVDMFHSFPVRIIVWFKKGIRQRAKCWFLCQEFVSFVSVSVCVCGYMFVFQCQAAVPAWINQMIKSSQMSHFCLNAAPIFAPRWTKAFLWGWGVAEIRSKTETPESAGLEFGFLSCFVFRLQGKCRFSPAWNVLVLSHSTGGGSGHWRQSSSPTACQQTAIEFQSVNSDTNWFFC